MDNICSVCQINKLSFLKGGAQLADGQICADCAKKTGLSVRGGKDKKLLKMLTVREYKAFYDNDLAFTDVSTLVASEEFQNMSADERVDFALQQRAEIDAQKAAYAKYVETVETGDLSDIASLNAPFLLKRGEYLYWQSDANVAWYEPRTSTKRVNYSGMTMNVRIAKGLSYRVGSIKPQRSTVTQDVQIHAGQLAVTNKRIVMFGADNAQITVGSIMDVEPYSDGMKVIKSRGKDVTLVGFNGEVPSILISRIISGQ